jgi:hypothetical protein
MGGETVLYGPRMKPFLQLPQWFRLSFAEGVLRDDLIKHPRKPLPEGEGRKGIGIRGFEDRRVCLLRRLWAHDLLYHEVGDDRKDRALQPRFQVMAAKRRNSLLNSWKSFLSSRER